MPAPVKVTTPEPLIEQIEALVASTVMATGRPEVEVAVGV